MGALRLVLLLSLFAVSFSQILTHDDRPLISYDMQDDIDGDDEVLA